MSHSPEADTATLQPDLEDQLQSDDEKKEDDQRNVGVVDTKEESDGEAFKVTLEPEDDPKQLPLVRKWIAVLVICTAALCVTCASSISGFAEAGEAADFHVSKEVAILGISLFVEGLGCGPLLLGPLSEFYGRNAVYWWSYAVYLALSFGVAFAPNIAKMSGSYEVK